jgi:hypothetical protein
VIDLLNLFDLFHVHADLKIDRIHLSARDEFFLSRAFSSGRHRNFWISARIGDCKEKHSRLPIPLPVQRRQACYTDFCSRASMTAGIKSQA